MTKSQTEKRISTLSVDYMKGERKLFGSCSFAVKADGGTCVCERKQDKLRHEEQTGALALKV